MAPAIAVAVLGAGTPSAAVDACAAPANEIVAENCKPGTPRVGLGRARRRERRDRRLRDRHQHRPGRHGLVQGRQSAAGYRIDLYRLGWYGGNGARKVGTIGPLAANDQPRLPGERGHRPRRLRRLVA